MPGLNLVSRTESPKTLIVVCPGVRTQSPETWDNGGDSLWLLSFPSDAVPDPAIYGFHHGLMGDEGSTWTNLLNQGYLLVESIIDLQHKDKQLQSIPIVFVAHSIGGFIVKQALCLVFQQTAHLRLLTRSVAAVIFLGSPHSRLEKDKLWSSVHSLLRSKHRYLRKQEMDLQDSRRLASLCVEFERSAANLPILSGYETEESSARSLTFKSGKSIIFEQSSITTNAKFEEFLRIPGTHWSICTINANSPILDKIAKFLQPEIEAARSRIDEEQETVGPILRLDEAVIAGAQDSDFEAIGESAFYVSGPVTVQRSDEKRNISSKPTYGHSEEPNERLSKLADFSVHRRDPQLPCRMIPFERNKDFINRTDLLSDLDEILAPLTASQVGTERQGLLTYALCGPGGMGKTQVAAEFALSHVDVFDAVFWVRADESTKLAADFSRISIELGLVLEASLEAKDLTVTRELVKGWLNKPIRSYTHPDGDIGDNATWLLVFDNVEDPEMLSDYWPIDGTVGSILITSRDPQAKTRLYQMEQGADLQPFSAEDSAKLLLQLTWREGDAVERTSVASVAHRLSDWPLALTQMAGVIVRLDLSFNEFAARYDEEEARTDLFALSFGARDKRRQPGAYSHTLASVWGLDGLERGKGLLEVMSILDPDELIEAVFEKAIGKISLPGFPETLTAYQNGRSELTKSSLISRNRSTQTLSLHRIIQDAVRAKMDPDRFKAVFDFAVQLLSRAWPSAGHGVRGDNRRWKNCEQLFPHVLSLKHHFSTAKQPLQNEIASNVEFAHLINELGWYFTERMLIDDAVPCFELNHKNLAYILQVQYSQNPTGNKTPPLPSADLDRAKFLQAETYRNLGEAALEIADVDPAFTNLMIYHGLMIDEFERMKDTIPADPRLAFSYNEAGVVQGFKRNYDESTRKSRKAVELSYGIPDQLKAVNIRSIGGANLALNLLYLSKTDEALSVAEKTLKEREQVLGINDRDSFITGRVLHALGNIHWELAQFELSLEYHQRALQHYKETVGTLHHRSGDLCFKLAQHFERQEAYDEARDFLDQALRIYGERHYQAERARIYWWKAKVAAQGFNKEECVRQAKRLLHQIASTKSALRDDLLDADFDEVVVYWSR